MVFRWLPNRLIGQISLTLAVIFTLLGILAFGADSIPLVREACQLTLRTLIVTFASFALFIVVFLFLLAVLVFLYHIVQGDRARYTFFVLIMFSIIVIANSLPMLIYLELSSAYISSNNLFNAVVSLLAANAMLYYFFHGFVSEIWEESQKLYVIGAGFRGISVLGQLKERAVWLLISYLSPLFYYIFSFTLFSDIILAGSSGSRYGIVSELFILLKYSETEWSWQFWIFLITMLAIVLPVRLVLDALVYAWEKSKSI